MSRRSADLGRPRWFGTRFHFFSVTHRGVPEAEIRDLLTDLPYSRRAGEPRYPTPAGLRCLLAALNPGKRRGPARRTWRRARTGDCLQAYQQHALGPERVVASSCPVCCPPIISPKRGGLRNHV
jgi:hypothetical protein